MSFLYSGQVVALTAGFTSTVTGTPTAQVYVEGVATGAAVNGTNVANIGTEDTWLFSVTLPSIDVGKYVVIKAIGVVSGITQVVDLAAGAIVEMLSSAASSGTAWPATWSNMSGAARHETLTLLDIVHSITLRSGATPSERHYARIVKAVQSAIRNMHAKHSWNYYKCQTRFTTSAQTSMEIEYDHTGGAHERLVTITDGDDFPDDAEYGEIVIGDQSYKVYRRLSDTTATLQADSSLTEDYEGEATWSRRAYSFGREIMKIEYCHNITANRQLTSLPSTEFNAISYSPIVSGYSRHFSWQNHGGKFGGAEFILHPAPIDAETIEVSAAVLPITPTIHSVSGTNLIGSIGDYTIASAGSSFTQKLVGCIIRISGNGTAPTDLNADNWDFQSFIASVDSATALTLSDALPQSFASTGYTISSPLDIEASVMLEAVEDEAFYQYTKNHDHTKAKISSEMAMKSLREAMTRDKRVGENSMDAGAFNQWNKTDFTQVATDD